MALLDAHLDQIEFCASSIGELPFQRPKIFTNALLGAHDITALIRDTESHERALFTLAPQAEYPSSDSSRRSTVFHNAPDAQDSSIFRGPRRNTAVAAVLGGDMAERIRRERGGQNSKRANGDIDVELLLKGAEKLCGVYPMPGALERIATLRRRHGKVQESLRHYEALVADQAAQLDKMNRPSGLSMEDDDEEIEDGQQHIGEDQEAPLTVEDLRREEESVKELEKKKQILEERVNGMEKDLGGLLR